MLKMFKKQQEVSVLDVPRLVQLLTDAVHEKTEAGNESIQLVIEWKTS